MSQKLILPINKMAITVGYKHPWYPKNQKGLIHYGVDAVAGNGKTYLYACGDGKVTHVGKDNICGNVVVVVYPQCKLTNGRVKDLAVRYFHLNSINVRVNQAVDIDTILGYYGNTGQYTSGAHLHFEVDTDTKYPHYTPTLKGNGTVLKAGTDSTIDPTTCMYLKKSAPEWQAVTNKYPGSVATSDLNYKEV